MTAAILMALGAVIVAVGVAMFSVPAGVIVLGGFVLVAGWDLARPGVPADVNVARYQAAARAGFLTAAEARRLEADGDEGVAA